MSSLYVVKVKGQTVSCSMPYQQAAQLASELNRKGNRSDAEVCIAVFRSGDKP